MRRGEQESRGFGQAAAEDISFLKGRFCAEIVYDRSAGGYFLESLGEYVLISIIGVPESRGAA